MQRNTSRLLLLTLVVLALVVPYSVAYAQGPGGDDTVIFGNNYTLESGETLDGSLTVLGGNVTLEPDSRVQGDVVAFGGNVSVAGVIEGNLAVIGGNVVLEDSAVVEGDVNSLGGNLDRGEGAVVEGEVVNGLRFEGNDGIPAIPVWPDIPGLPPLPDALGEGPTIEFSDGGRSDSPGNWVLGYFLHGLSAVAWSAFLAVLGVLVAVLFPRQGGRVTGTVRNQPLVSFGAGCLTWALGIPALVLLAITLCLLPLALILSLLLVVAALLGWVAVGWVIGQKVLEALRMQNATPIIEVVVGVVLLTLLWQMPRVVPCIGWSISLGVGIIAGSIGLGAVLLTRFGTRPYPAAPTFTGSVPPPPQGPTPPALPEPSQPALPERSDN